MKESKIHILVLYANYTDRLSYYDDWLLAFSHSDNFDFDSIDIVKKDSIARLNDTIKDYDALILLHSTNGDTVEYIKPYSSLLKDRTCSLLSFVGNEVNLPGSPISEKRDFFKDIQPEYIATQLQKKSGEYLFGDLVTECVVEIPHALNPDVFKKQINVKERTWDIGVRAVKYLPHLGDNDRNRVHDYFKNLRNRDLKISISDERFNREGWATFLNQCRNTVSTEAGSWFIEKDDATVNAIRDWVNNKNHNIVIKNDSPLRTLGHKLPWWLRAFIKNILSKGPVQHESKMNEKLSYDDVYERFFADKKIPKLHGKCISSRHFDAIGTGTCQVLLEGEYNNILNPSEHYIELKKDFSNADDVVRSITDVNVIDCITKAAYEHVIENHTYKHRVNYVYELFNN